MNCDGCGYVIRQPRIRLGDHAFCQMCHDERFVRILCGQCVRLVSTPNGEGPAICNHCRAKGHRCFRCNKVLEYVARITDEGYACEECSRYLGEPKVCEVCGEEKLRLAGWDAEGRAVCGACRLIGHKNFVCPICNMQGKKYFSPKWCWDCYWEANARKTARALAETLTADWAKELYLGYASDITAKIDSGSASRYVRKHIGFFSALETGCDGPNRISVESLLQIFGPDGFRRFCLPVAFLQRVGLVARVSEQDWEKAKEEAHQRNILRKAQGTWYEPVLCGYQRYLSDHAWEGECTDLKKSRMRFRPATITRALYNTSTFLETLNPGDVEDAFHIRQHHYEEFLQDQPAVGQGLRRFVTYLNEEVKVVSPIKLGPLKRPLATGTLVFDYATRTALVRKLIRPPDGFLRDAIIVLMILVYAQGPKKIVRMKRSNFRRDKQGCYHATFGDTEIALNRYLNVLLDRYLTHDRRRSILLDDVGYMFPGMVPGQPVSYAAIRRSLKAIVVSVNELRASAIARFFLDGLNHPKVLAKALGISCETSNRYHRVFSPLAIKPGRL